MRRSYDNLERRLTFRYRDGFSDNDEWMPVGSYRKLTYREVWEDSDSGVRLMTVKVASDRPVAEVIEALQRYLTYGCHCEHDCCGHVFCHFVDVRRTRRNEYFVVQHLGRNC
jgi:hypothetical protein